MRVRLFERADTPKGTDTMDEFTPLLSTNDWNEEWKRLQIARRKADDASFWDERSKTFGTKLGKNPYADRFIELAAIREGETVFDMGCGTGALSVPLGLAGHTVIAADFSTGMLKAMQDGLAAADVHCVKALKMSWADDWESAGVGSNSVDVALASRSIATNDMRDSLMRLTDVARRRVCITLATGSSPRSDERIMGALGLQNLVGRDYLYAFNILSQAGMRPEVSYIDSERVDTFEDAEDAFSTFARMIEDVRFMVGATRADRALDQLREWLDAHLVANPDAGTPDEKGLAQKALKLDKPRVITWAFISWNK